MRWLPWALIACSIVLCVPSLTMAGDEWGHLQGTFVFEGVPPMPQHLRIDKDVDVFGDRPLFDESLVVDQKTRGIANIVIYLRAADAPVHPDVAQAARGEVVLKLERGRFDRRVVAMNVSQKLLIHNLDPVAHCAKISTLQNPPAASLIPVTRRTEYTFDVAERFPVTVDCMIHAWMRSYLMIHANPYVVASGKDGSFSMANLPAGEWEFQFWHERSGYVVARPDWRRGRVKLKIEPGETLDLGTIKLSPDLFDRE